MTDIISITDILIFAIVGVIGLAAIARFVVLPIRDDSIIEHRRGWYWIVTL
jgi:hypothetical protein